MASYCCWFPFFWRLCCFWVPVASGFRLVLTSSPLLAPPYFQLTSLFLSSLLLLESLLLLASPLLLESAGVYSFPGIPFCAVPAVAVVLLLPAFTAVVLIRNQHKLPFWPIIFLLTKYENNWTIKYRTDGCLLTHPQQKSINIVAVLHIIIIALTRIEWSRYLLAETTFSYIANRIHCNDYMCTVA